MSFRYASSSRGFLICERSEGELTGRCTSVSSKALAPIGPQTHFCDDGKYPAKTSTMKSGSEFGSVRFFRINSASGCGRDILSLLLAILDLRFIPDFYNILAGRP